MARAPTTLRLDDPYPKPLAPNLSLVPQEEQNKNSNVSIKDGILRIDHADGSTTIDFNPDIKDLNPDAKDGEDEFSRNLAMQMDDEELGTIATDLLEGIKRDDESRKDWLETRAMGISLLGLKLEKPRSDISSSSAPLEGMSTVRHPLLLEATVSFQATARAELLPASGPVKVRNDTPMPPKSVVMEGPGSAALQDSMESKDDLGQALEKDMNHYLTDIATEYVPDTDRMLFYTGFGGDGFKKVYNCPLRRRPVSESIDAEDLIVSNYATDLQNSGRITHRIKMRKSTLIRMQILGAYRDVALAPPSATSGQNIVDKKKEEIAGVTTSDQRPQDRDYEIYETYCELDLDAFAPKQFKGKGLPLPYRVTIEKDSRQVLDVRRNWAEDDAECLAKRYFVQFPFIRGLGFYGLGYIHLLGNTTIALTASWRLQLDNGMFSNFPGFIYNKALGRQITNQFRIPPGGGVGLDVPMQMGIRDAVMPLPYKETGPAFNAFSTHVEEVGQRLSSTANIKVGEGKQDAPVGTTLALIEQASKVMDSAHKRLHAAQAEEFKLLKERFREDPEAFWRHNKKTTVQWQKDQFLQALHDHELVPVADPNNPTSLHRIAKAMAIKTLQQASPDLYDPTGVDMRIMRIVDIDPAGLFRPAPAPPPPDPRMVAIQQKSKSQDQQAQIQLLEAQIKAKTAEAQMLDKAKDRESREKLESMKIEIQKLKLQSEQIIHAHDAERDAAMAAHQAQMDQIAHNQELRAKQVTQAHELHADAAGRAHEIRADQIQNMSDLETQRTRQAAEDRMAQERHNADMNRAEREHAQKMQHNQELHGHKLEAAKQMAKVAKSAKVKKD